MQILLLCNLQGVVAISPLSQNFFLIAARTSSERHTHIIHSTGLGRTMSIYAIQSILQIQKSRISPQCLYKFVEYRSRRLLLRAGQYKKNFTVHIRPRHFKSTPSYLFQRTPLYISVDLFHAAWTSYCNSLLN